METKKDEIDMIHENKSRDLQKQDKYLRYLKWATDNGAILDNVHKALIKLQYEFPAAFGKDGALLGVAAKKDIQHNEVSFRKVILIQIIVYVPQKLLITVEKALVSEISQVIKQHDSVFKSHSDRDYLILLVFLMYEHGKGEASFWYPYF